MTNFEKNIQQMFKGIELCLNQKLQFPTLTLIYTIIRYYVATAQFNKS